MKTAFSIVTGVLLAGFFVCAGAQAAQKRIEKKGEFYELVISSEKGRTEIRVQGKNGYHCNTSYPWKLTVGEGDAEQVLKKKQAKKFSEKEVVFVFESKKRAAKLKMSMCNDKQCKMEKLPLSW